MHQKIRLFPALSLTVLLLLFTGCATGMNADPGSCPESLEISVWYKERIALPPGSTLTVRIGDISRMDIAAKVLMEQTVDLETAPPYTVHFDYDCRILDERARYSVRARIENNGKLLFINTSAVDPFAGTPGKPVEVMVQRVAH